MEVMFDLCLVQMIENLTSDRLLDVFRNFFSHICTFEKYFCFVSFVKRNPAERVHVGIDQTSQ